MRLESLIESICDLRGLSWTEKAVLFNLASHANRLKVAQVKQSQVAKETGLSRVTVNRACKSLETKGFLAVKRMGNPDGVRQPNRYWLNVYEHDFAVMLWELEVFQKQSANWN